MRRGKLCCVVVVRGDVWWCGGWLVRCGVKHERVWRVCLLSVSGLFIRVLTSFFCHSSSNALIMCVRGVFASGAKFSSKSEYPRSNPTFPTLSNLFSSTRPSSCGSCCRKTAERNDKMPNCVHDSLRPASVRPTTHKTTDDTPEFRFTNDRNNSHQHLGIGHVL